MTDIGGYSVIVGWTDSSNGSHALAVRDGREYFLKRLPQPRVPSRSMLTPEAFEARSVECIGWEEGRRRLISAVSRAAEICPYINAPAEVFPCGSSYYIASLRVCGEPLDPDACYSLDLKDKIALMRRIAETLAALDSEGVVHGDLKRGNILVDGDLRPMVVDFDDSFLASEPPAPGSVIASPEYCSPELRAYMSSRSDEKVTSRSDVFSAGLLFHEVITGSRAVCRRGTYPYEAVRRRDLRLSVPRGPLRDLVSDMLDPDPESRPDAGSVLARLPPERGAAAPFP